MVVMSLEKYSNIMKNLDMEEALEARFGTRDIEEVLDEMDEEIERSDIKFMTHEEVFSKLRRELNEE